MKGLTGGAEGPIPIPHSKITFAPNPFLDLMATEGRGLKSIVVHYDWQEVGEIVEAPPSSEPTSTVAVSRAPGHSRRSAHRRPDRGRDRQRHARNPGRHGLGPG